MNPVQSVKYSSIDDAVEMIQSLGKRAKLGISDIKKAFRLLPVWPGDFDLLGFRIKDKFYFDKFLPMGASISCALPVFEKFSTFIQWAVEYESDNKPSILHYLDDFLFGGKSETTQCQETMHTFEQVCTSLGIPIANKKTKGPSTVITFLGVEFDTINMELRLPSEQLQKLQLQLDHILHKDKITLLQLQSLLGSLNFACRVVRPGRAFLRRLYDVSTLVKRQHHKIPINKSMKDDLKLWKKFFLSYNGVTVMPGMFWTDNESLELYTDSAGGKDRCFGIYFQGQWTHELWSDSWRKRL